MAVYVNIAPREHEEKRISLERAHAGSFKEATGYKETTKYTGKWLDMVDMALQLVAEPEDKWAVACDLERQGGELGELTVTKTEYRTAEGEEAEVGTAENPAYTCSFTVQAEPLLTHPYFDGVSKADMELLCEIENGTSPYAVVMYKGTYMQLATAAGMLSGPAAMARDYYYKGVTQYYEIYADATARWRGAASGAFEIGKICTPPGSCVTTPSGRNWMCVGTGQEKQGEEVYSSASFRLSGRGGWDPVLYGG